MVDEHFYRTDRHIHPARRETVPGEACFVYPAWSEAPGDVPEEHKVAGKFIERILKSKCSFTADSAVTPRFEEEVSRDPATQPEWAASFWEGTTHGTYLGLTDFLEISNLEISSGHTLT